MHGHWHRSTSRLASLVVVGASVTLVAGCGGSSSSSSQRPSTGSSAAATTAGPSTAGTTVTIASFMFTPATITIKKRTSVTFENKDNASHTATADGASFDAGTLAPGSSKTITFSTVGRFTYHCAFHPFMHGTVVVQ